MIDGRIALFRHLNQSEKHHNIEGVHIAMSTTPIPTPAPAPDDQPQVSAPPVTVAVAHPSGLDKFESILAVISKLVATDAPIVLQLFKSPKVAIGFGIGEVAIELAAEAATAIQAIKANSPVAQ